ncbi:MAG: FtsX-like permease family protein [Nitrososphaerota archaeon]|nr:ABC transporter permease [Candidatus Bathyarchaeota archaeon]MDW8048231.1 FtsX-like permease family protein [Nitrososphaerota archaeon]
MSFELSLALRNLGRRKLRTGLTVSGIVVGITLMFVLMSLISTMDVQSRRMIRALGGADITVSNSTRMGRFGFEGFLMTTITMDQSIMNIIKDIAGVYAVSPQLSLNGFVNGNRCSLNGIDPETYYIVVGDLNIVSGRTLSRDDNYRIVLGRTLADNAGIGVGQTVTVGMNSTSGYRFTVIGIFETGMPFQEMVGYILLSDAQAISNQEGLVTQILVKCIDPNDVSTITEKISNMIPGVRVTVPTGTVQQASQMLNTLTMFFATIGLVALVAGSFGVVNTMVMSVSERTREIGTLKAIGAKNIEILKIFLTEALLIGLLGGLIGVGAGIALSYLFPYLSQFIGFIPTGGTPFGRMGPGLRGASTITLTPTLDPLIIFFCLSLGILVGVLAGLYPAWRASRMKPVEALRHV